MFAQSSSAGPTAVSELFSTYQLGEPYDEMFERNGAPRMHCGGLV